MCAPGTMESVFGRLTRRGLFGGAAGGAFLATSAVLPGAARAQTMPAFRKVIDLSHTFSPDFPTFSGEPGIALKRVFNLKDHGYNLFEWTLNEHSATHMDAPIHFSADGIGPEAIPAERLVVPLAVVDISAKAAQNPDSQVTVDDLKAWEAANGALPENCCVAMNSGWDKHTASPKFAGKDTGGGLHFPGFAPDAAAFLMNERRVLGIAVDTLSLDYGASKDFKTHYSWLPSGRWGLECVANLGECPARGATLVVGAPKVKGATGGPARVLALV